MVAHVQWLWRGVPRGCVDKPTLDCLVLGRCGDGYWGWGCVLWDTVNERASCCMSWGWASNVLDLGGGRGVEVVMELIAAAFSGDVAEVRRLAALRVDVNVEGPGGARPLHYAAQNGHVLWERTCTQKMPME
jgi:hypothetical protein